MRSSSSVAARRGLAASLFPLTSPQPRHRAAFLAIARLLTTLKTQTSSPSSLPRTEECRNKPQQPKKEEQPRKKTAKKPAPEARKMKPQQQHQSYIKPSATMPGDRKQDSLKSYAKGGSGTGGGGAGEMSKVFEKYVNVLDVPGYVLTLDCHLPSLSSSLPYLLNSLFLPYLFSIAFFLSHSSLSTPHSCVKHYSSLLIPFFPSSPQPPPPPRIFLHSS